MKTDTARVAVAVNGATGRIVIVRDVIETERLNERNGPGIETGRGRGKEVIEVIGTGDTGSMKTITVVDRVVVVTTTMTDAADDTMTRRRLLRLGAVGITHPLRVVADHLRPWRAA